MGTGIRLQERDERFEDVREGKLIDLWDGTVSAAENIRSRYYLIY
jgi:hypothetical protein